MCTVRFSDLAETEGSMQVDRGLQAQLQSMGRMQGKLGDGTRA